MSVAQLGSFNRCLSVSKSIAVASMADRPHETGHRELPPPVARMRRGIYQREASASAATKAGLHRGMAP
eukprot:CAMPEP_0175762200 /NCGR_PEP_ID=MMETSP0097-20121207/67069_1 /TAXON_ID=311494 /ORGANISM="Alexandrium monilatum, Strain CCMP3105" /LENGTH=68 /DNA_ID=CAMNT_0017071831 /DNA_START=11 /DNA_END=218 /DNA_ORIENTATION=+